MLYYIFFVTWYIALDTICRVRHYFFLHKASGPIISGSVESMEDYKFVVFGLQVRIPVRDILLETSETNSPPVAPLEI